MITVAARSSSDAVSVLVTREFIDVDPSYIFFIQAAADSDEVQPLEGRADIVDDPDMVCKYNNLTLLRGEKLNNADKCVECTCVNPPIVDCKRKPRC